MLRLCSMLLHLMIFFSGASLVLLIPGSKQASRLSFIFIKMADMVSAWVIPIEPVIVGSMHSCTGWMLMAFLRSPGNNFISNHPNQLYIHNKMGCFDALTYRSNKARQSELTIGHPALNGESLG